MLEWPKLAESVAGKHSETRSLLHPLLAILSYLLGTIFVYSSFFLDMVAAALKFTSLCMLWILLAQVPSSGTFMKAIMLMGNTNH